MCFVHDKFYHDLAKSQTRAVWLEEQHTNGGPQTWLMMLFPAHNNMFYQLSFVLLFLKI